MALEAGQSFVKYIGHVQCSVHCRLFASTLTFFQLHVSNTPPSRDNQKCPQTLSNAVSWEPLKNYFHCVKIMMFKISRFWGIEYWDLAFSVWNVLILLNILSRKKTEMEIIISLCSFEKAIQRVYRSFKPASSQKSRKNTLSIRLSFAGNKILTYEFSFPTWEHREFIGSKKGSTAVITELLLA